MLQKYVRLMISPAGKNLNGVVAKICFKDMTLNL